ncbi:hypothetical protein D3C77_207270 [compost metagenome]
MGFATASFLTAVEQVAHQALVEVVIAAELGDRHSDSIELFACLIRCEGGGHSVLLCSNVFMY